MTADRTNAKPVDEVLLFQGLGMLKLRPWRELSAAALISLELSWLSIGYLYFSPPSLHADFSRIYLLFGLNMTAAYVIARVMFLLKFTPASRRILLLGAYLLASLMMLQALYEPTALLNLLAPFRRISAEMRSPLILIPAELMLVGLSAYLWYRAVSLAHGWIDPAVALRSFGLGAFMLTLLGLLAAFGGAERLAASLVVFTASGLLALGSARAASLGRLRGSRQTRFTPVWILGILVSVAGIELLSLVLGRAASGVPAVWVALAFALLVRVVLIVGALLVSPLLLLLSLSWPWLKQQAETSALLQNMGRELANLVAFVTRLLVDLSTFMQGFFESMPDISRLKPWLFGAGGLALIGLLSLWFGRRWRLPWPGRAEALENSERLSVRRAGSRLSQSLQEGLQLLSERLSSLLPGRGMLGALRIRRLYARLMRLCLDLGSPRSSSVTPLEFLPKLWQLFPGAREEARAMTEAYNRVRYGDLPETRAEVELVELAWGKIKQEANRLHQVQRQLESRGSRALRGD